MKIHTMFRALKLPLLGIVLLFLGAASDGFVTYKYQAHQMEIQGTSNFQPWTVNVNEIGLQTKLRVNEAGNISLVGASAIVIRAGSIVAPRHSLMDIKIYRALRGQDHPYITFKLSKVNTRPLAHQVTFIEGEGVLNIAGENKIVPIKLYARVLPNKKIEMWGGNVIDVRTLGIKPPQSFWGAFQYDPVVNMTFSIILHATK